MKNFIHNTSLNRALLALAVSMAAGGVASATPAGTVTSTVTTPAWYSSYSAADPVPFDGSIAVTVNGASGTANYSYYFLDSLRVMHSLGGDTPTVYSVQNPTTITLSVHPGTTLPADYYQAKIDCTLSAPGSTDVTSHASNTFGVH